MPAVDQIESATQSVWLDGLSRGMLASNELEQMLSQCRITGMTAGPIDFARELVDGTAYGPAVAEHGEQARNDPESVFWELAVEDQRRAADLLADRYEATSGVDGYVSLEMPPTIADDADAMVARAVDVVQRVERPNVMVAVPGTAAGRRALEQLTARGISTNVTLLFGVDQYEAARDGYLAGLTERAERGEPLDQVASVATIWLASLDAKGNATLPSDNHNEVGLAIARLAYERWLMHTVDRNWMRLRRKGARPQRLAWASIDPIDPAAEPTFYPERLVAPETIVALRPDTLGQLSKLERIRHPRLDRRDVGKAVHVATVAAEHEVELGAVADELQAEAISRSTQSFQSLLEQIRSSATAPT